MVSALVVIFIFLSVLYTYVNHNKEFSATASAIQEIWSGTCRRSCRRTEYSAVSGLSGLELMKPGTHGTEDIVGGSDDCVCETCPCELINNVLKTCSPATNFYSRCIEAISNFYYDIVKTLSDLYVYVDQIMNCGASCQRHNEITYRTSLTEDEIINIGQRIEEGGQKLKAGGQKLKEEGIKLKEEGLKLKEDAKKVDKSLLNLKRTRSITFRDHSDEAGTSRPQSANLQRDSSPVDSSCSRCIEKGKTCIGLCPKAKEKNN